ncbi:DNA mismatch repair endonuclease MutL [Leptothoe sp. PORK10 BA2]|uniref:DNA mismatch repair endonuclease MutL n=1 Tax=Leptothoe sp. PORK10 BA2 TaxID=3110254 RepID=UPI002B20982C|nr:DNA mismatch repair endonuclease MutL [Leptothoe sp. PORK10 BA2]MEA5463661.1 DNA mismatch repair endonuclease MutL [Leptothoe sp. PORK10 BA2]
MDTALPIQRLSQDVISLIAAGEVIDSLAAVVRELSENALDADATRIAIHLWPEVWRVRVTDNGRGMDRANLEQAATAHSTSKIRTCDDLSKIQSLGFRGEALHSLAQLSQLEIRSRKTGDVGWRVTYGSEGLVVDLEEVAIAPGTVVTADHLFARLPNRRQILPAVAQQLRQVQQTVQQLALCHPHVTWQVGHTDRDWFTLWPGATAKTVLPQILRDVTSHDLAQVSLEAEELGCDQGQLELLVGLPDRCHRRRPDWVRVAINGRTVTAPVLVQSMIHNFRRTLPRDRYPVCFLHLRVPAAQVDWNRNPAKSEIYLQDMEGWCDRIALAIEKALRLSNLAHEAHTQRTQQLFKTAEATASYGATDQNFPSQLKAVAQVQNTYIVAEHSGGLCLVEQHIAHERVIYEQIKTQWQTVPMEPAIILSQLRPRQVEQLRRLSLDVDPFGENLWAIRHVPAPLADRDDCAEALLELSLGSDVDAAMVATACRTAIRNGTPLDLETMQKLLDNWQRTQSPRTCPHGRPICLTLEESSLSRYFRRHWVIGKSHGLKP